MVLTKVLEIKGKLDEKWEGPFELIRPIGKVNFQVWADDRKKEKSCTCKQLQNMEGGGDSSWT